MTPEELAVEAPNAFAELVKRLRALGVTRLGDLVLGPEPREPGERTERTSDLPTPRRALEKMHATMFAATSIRPPLPETSAPTSAAPRAVVQRRARNEEGRHGSQEGSSR